MEKKKKSVERTKRKEKTRQDNIRKGINKKNRKDGV